LNTVSGKVINVMSRAQNPGFLYGLYQKRLRRGLDQENLPHHIGMIVDGNRRWARERYLENPSHGHRAGAQKVPEFLVWCDDIGIQMVTLYLLSTDNLTGRNQQELDELFSIIGELATGLSHFRNWKIHHVGKDDVLPAKLLDTLLEAEERTQDNTGLHVNLAIGYGGRAEIADAVRSIIGDHSGSLDDLADKLTPELIGDHLYTGGLPDPDLVIRTSGEQRLSDFMLWQSAHSEFYFVEALYPDLREVDFLRAMRDYSRRDRRFGG
jgi:short-chain Z-isoprenyl diphosphate synthase